MLSSFAYSVTAILTRVIRWASSPKCDEASWISTCSSESVSVYSKLLQQSYIRKGSVEHLERLRVAQVRLAKRKDWPDHEYISAKMVGPNRDHFYFVFERVHGSIINFNAGTNTAAMQEEVAFTPPWAARIHNHDSADSMRLAYDIVSYRDIRERLRSTGDTVYRTLDLSSTQTPLYFYELVTLAAVIHKAEGQHLLRNEQRYWYAGTIIRVLQDVCGEKPDFTVTVHTTGSPEEDRRHKLGKIRNSKSGKEKSWQDIPIYANLSPSDVTPIIETFHREADTVKQEVIKERQKRAEAIHPERELLLCEQHYLNDLNASLDKERQKLVEERDRLEKKLMEELDNQRQKLAELKEEHDRLQQVNLNASTEHSSSQL